MQNKTKNTIKALKALITENESPSGIAFNLQTILMGYLTTDFYCGAEERERQNFLFAAQSTIDFFRYIKNTKANNFHDSLYQYLNTIEPKQAISVWSEATFGFVQQDQYCEKDDLDRSCLIHTAQSLLKFFADIQ